MNTITIHNQVQHRIEDGIYGQFIEEVGEGIHNGLWTYSDVLKRLPHLSEPLGGVREDLFEALRPLFHTDEARRTIVRWPGGCFADSYHWKDGIGPRENRVIRRNGHWSRMPYRFLRSADGVPGPEYNNHFGTDEFLALCGRLGGSPYITVNYGTGTPEEAANWVQYVNGSEQTRWGSERAKIHPQPYNVRYWGIGNEIWGRWELGYERSAAKYGWQYVKFAEAMKARDPSIFLVACGLDPNAQGPLLPRDSATWNRTVLYEVEGLVDLLSMHYYVPVNTASWWQLLGSARYAQTESAYWAILASPALVRDALGRMWRDVVETLGADTRVRLALDEWNVWYNYKQVIKANYTLTDGLWVACMLHLLQELSPIIGMANLAQLVNVLGLIRTDNDGIVLTPSYHVFRLLREHAHPKLLKADVDCGSYINPQTLGIPPCDTPYVSCAATAADEDNKLTVSIVNRHFRESIHAIVRFEGFPVLPQFRECIRLSDDNPFAMNTPRDRDAVRPRKLTLEPTAEQRYTLPPHSFTLLTWTIEQ